jgi:hypothetical protein
LADAVGVIIDKLFHLSTKVKCKKFQFTEGTPGSKYFTLLEKCSKPIPIGMKATPMMKKVGKTVPAVRMGCQAGNRCCLKALSVNG